MRRWWILAAAAAAVAAAVGLGGGATADVPGTRAASVVAGRTGARPSVRTPGLPLVFEANRGQAPQGWDFLVRCRGYHAFVAPTKVVFALDGCALTMSVGGAAVCAPDTAGRELPGRSNYFLGSDPAKWITGVPQYDGARYAGAVRGASWSVGGRGRALEFAFEVAPGAQTPPLRLDGHRGVHVGDRGELRIDMPHGVATFSPPVAWQGTGDDERSVAAAWTLEPDGEVRVGLGPHDAALAVNVDPTVIYETYLGGSGNESSNGVAMDAAGCAYMCGLTPSANFPTTPSAFDTSLGATQDGFVTKLAAAGTSLVYSTFLGGASTDSLLGIALDASGRAHVSGSSASSDYPTTAGSLYPTKATGDQGVVTRLSAAGDALEYSTYMNGLGTAMIAPSVGAAGVLHVAKQTSGSVYTLAADGASLVWQQQVATASGDNVTASCTDVAGNLYLAGTSTSGSFVTTAGAYDTTQSGSDAFLVKLDPLGGVVFATLLGGTGSEQAYSVGVNLAQQPYVAGDTASANFPVTPDAYQVPTGSVGTPGFATRFLASGAGLRYSTVLRATINTVQIRGIAVHPTGSFVVMGSTNSSGLPLSNAWQGTFGGGNDAFAAKFERTGTLAWSSYIGGSQSDNGRGIAMGLDGTVVILEDSPSSDHPTLNPYQSSLLGTRDPVLTTVNDDLVTDLAVPAISTTALAASTIGIPYSQAIVFTGGLAPFKWTVVSGGLHTGLTVSGTGLVSGTPTQTGDLAVTVRVEDSCDLVAPDRSVTLRINPLPQISDPVVPAWTLGRPFDWTIPAAGGTGTLVFAPVSGSLPAGTDLSASGHVYGTPQADGDFTLTVRVTDAVGATTTRACIWHVASSPVIAAETLGEWTEARPYSHQFQLTGGSGTRTWSVVAGTAPVYTLPDAATGLLSGTTRAAGDYAFTLEVADGAGATTQRAFAMKLNPFPAIVNEPLPLAMAGRPYSVTLLGTGGSPPVLWARDTTIPGSAFPQGISLAGAVLSGTPSEADRKLPVIMYSDAHGAVARRLFVLDVAGGLDLSRRKAAEVLSLASDAPGSSKRYLELLEGTTLTASLKLKGKGVFGADLVLLGTGGEVLDVAAFKKVTPKSVALTKVPIPATGRYVLSVVRATDSEGEATLGVSIAPKTSWPGGGAVTQGAPVEFVFAAPPGATVTIGAKSAKGSVALPHIVAVLDEHDVDLAAGASPKESGKAASLKLARALAGGRYRVRFAARDANAGDITWSVALKLPKTYDFELPDLGAGDGN